MIGEIIIEEYRKSYSEKMNEDGCTILFNGYFESVFQDFEGYLRTKRASEDDIELLLKQYKSKFNTYKRIPGFYSKKYISDVLISLGCQVQHNDSSMKTNLLTDKNLRLDKNSFLIFY